MERVKPLFNRISGLVVIFFIVFILLLVVSSEVNAKTVYTVDDLRDLVGKQRVDSIYTEHEIQEIITKYNAIEKTNLYAKMFQIGKEIDIDSEVEKDLRALEKQIETLSIELEIKYKEGASTKEVLRLKTELETLVHKMDSLRKIGFYIEVDFKENKWSEKYEKVQEAIEHMSNDFDIGDIGGKLRSPVYSGFRITSPFGFRIDPITKDALTFHGGLDLGAPEDDYIFSLWNGIVSNVYESEGGGKTVEISHGNNLKTRYLHLNYIDVSIGEEVNQYDIIGGAGSTGTRSTGVHLHLEVILDGENINPLYVFGNMGLRAFKEYISYNPDRNRELYTVEKEIKNNPSKEKEEEPKTSKYYRPSDIKEGEVITQIKDGTKEPEPFTYEIPLGLSDDEQELIDFIDNVLRKNEDIEEDTEVEMGESND